MSFVKDFYRKARYPLDLGAAKPVKRRTKCDWPGRPDSGITSDKAEASDKIKSDKARLDKAKLDTAWSDKICKSGGASDGGVAQLVRAAES